MRSGRSPSEGRHRRRPRARSASATARAPARPATASTRRCRASSSARRRPRRRRARSRRHHRPPARRPPRHRRASAIAHAEPLADPDGHPDASPTPVPSPSPGTAPLTIAGARAVAVGAPAFTRGVVVAEAGRLGTPPLSWRSRDATGGMPVRVAGRQSRCLRGDARRGARPDGRPVRPARAPPDRDRASPSSARRRCPRRPRSVPAQAGEATEGRLATVRGTVAAAPTKATSGDITFTIKGSDGAALRDPGRRQRRTSTSPSCAREPCATFTGIVGQRASRKGVLDGYRLWIRDRADIASVTQPGPASSATPKPSGSAGSGAASVVSIATAKARDGKTVTIEGVLTTSRTLLDASGPAGDRRGPDAARSRPTCPRPMAG